MKTILAIWILFVGSSVGVADDMVMRAYGTYSFSGEDYDVVVELKELREGELAPLITFRKGEITGTTGIGEGSSISVIDGQWAVEFFPPHELWIFNGDARIDLYERTTNPRGFKASSSTVVPKLRNRAPKSLKKIIADSASEKTEKPRRAE